MGTLTLLNNTDQYYASYDIALNKDGPRYVFSDSGIILIAFTVAQKKKKKKRAGWKSVRLMDIRNYFENSLKNRITAFFSANR